MNIEAILLQHLLDTLCLTSVCHYLLGLSTKLRIWIVHGNYGIFLLSLFAPIALVHIKCAKCIWSKWHVCRWLIENKKTNTVRVCLLEIWYCIINLCKELCVIPLCITTCTWICDTPSIPYHDPILIMDNKSSILFLNKIQNVYDLTLPLFHQLLLFQPPPIHNYEDHIPRSLIVCTKCFSYIHWHEKSFHLGTVWSPSFHLALSPDWCVQVWICLGPIAPFIFQVRPSGEGRLYCSIPLHLVIHGHPCIPLSSVLCTTIQACKATSKPCAMTGHFPWAHIWVMGGCAH